MPHVVLENISSTRAAFDSITPFATQTDAGILKVIDKYLNAEQNKVLVEALAIEQGNNQNFFVQLSRKQNSLTVRLLPLTDPEKTKGVKTLLAMIARQIKEANADVSYGKNNLQDFLMD